MKTFKITLTNDCGTAKVFGTSYKAGTDGFFVLNNDKLVIWIDLEEIDSVVMIEADWGRVTETVIVSTPKETDDVLGEIDNIINN